MSPTASQVSSPRPVLPPEEQFWQRYSPHNEFSLSTVGSITIYVLLGLLILAGIKLNLFDRTPPPLAWDTRELGDGDDPNAIGPGDGGPPRDGPPGIPRVAPTQGTPMPLPTPGLPQPLDLPPDDRNDALLNEYPDLFKRLAEPVIPGNTGPRSGSPSGDPNGNGGQGGPRPGTPGARPAPQRWNLVFTTENGEDYRRQLEGMGATLVIPTADGKLQVIRNLTAPVTPVVEDGRSLTGIGWRDDRPQSVANLAAALGLPEAPLYVFAFFPPQTEARFRKLEQDFAQRAGRQQRAIKETRFTVTFNRRTNQYEMVVTDQR